MVATASAAAAVLGPADVLKRVKDAFETLSPEVRRAARWLSDHSTEVALLSMRHQARSAGVSPPTMIRLARALGFADYASLRRPFQEAITGGRVRFGRRASALQSAPAATRIARLMREIVDAQVDDLRSVQTLNSPAQIDSAVKAIARARRVGFLGVRASFSIAYNFRYAYNLIATNGVLFDGLGGILLDQVEALERGDTLVAISQAPYSAPTVEALDAAKRRGVATVALTDSALSPLARRAAHTLLFRTESLSFFPSMIAPLALVEVLLARLAARGGRAVLDRIAEVERRLAASRAYWPEDGREARAGA
jgi:DNA-binding MurR/RpiR family transcriptional regulator